MDSITIPYNPDLIAIENIISGDNGIIIGHGERSRIEEGILNSLSKKLYSRKISTVLFNFPFRMLNKKKVDNIETLDQAFLKVWNYVKEKFPDKRWSVSGHGIGVESAIRMSGLIFSDEGIPPVIGLSYPMYPLNRPELVNTNTLGALMGDALFCQGDQSKRGTYDRLRNQIQMMAGHAHVKKIKGANHNLEVLGKPIETVAHWISNDIEKFLKNV